MRRPRVRRNDADANSLSARDPYRFFDFAKAAAPAKDISCFRPSNMPPIIRETSFGAVAGSQR
jgi:hypothetical protein